MKIYSPQDEQPGEPELPPNYVRIVASSEIEGVKKQVEGIWVNAMAAFSNTYTAGNNLELVTHHVASRAILGNVHDNAWDGGEIDIGPGSVLYGDVTSRGEVKLGDAESSKAALVYGSVWGESVDVSQGSEIRRFEDLSEWTEGIDLNGDGDTADMGLSRAPLQVAGVTRVAAAGRRLHDGDRDLRIGGGTVSIRTGTPGVGAIVDPRPDFAAYYELTTGGSSYPPARPHVTTAISGDGEGHYFASSELFINWLSQPQSDVLCWRCAGDGRIDPGNTTECPTCGGTGRDKAVVISGCCSTHLSMAVWWSGPTFRARPPVWVFIAITPTPLAAAFFIAWRKVWSSELVKLKPTTTTS